MQLCRYQCQPGLNKGRQVGREGQREKEKSSRIKCSCAVISASLGYIQADRQEEKDRERGEKEQLGKMQLCRYQCQPGLNIDRQVGREGQRQREKEQQDKMQLCRYQCQPGLNIDRQVGREGERRKKSSRIKCSCADISASLG